MTRIWSCSRCPVGARKVVQRGGFHGRYVSSGHLLYVHDGALFAVTFRSRSARGHRPADTCLDQIVSHDGTGGAQFDVSRQGTLVYLPGSGISTLLPIHWLGREGPTTGSPSNTIQLVQPFDSLPMAVASRWRCVTSRPATCMSMTGSETNLTRLTRDRAHDGEPVWTPDGGRLTFYSERADGLTANLYWQSVDRPTEAERLTASKHVQVPGSWHPSGRFLAFEERRVQDTGDLMILPIEGDEQSGWKPATPTVFLSTPANEREPMFFTGWSMARVLVQRIRQVRSLRAALSWPRHQVDHLGGWRQLPDLVAHQPGAVLRYAHRADHVGIVYSSGRHLSRRESAAVGEGTICRAGAKPHVRPAPGWPAVCGGAGAVHERGKARSPQFHPQFRRGAPAPRSDLRKGERAVSRSNAARLARTPGRSDRAPGRGPRLPRSGP